ncbi:MAG: FG-GAP repeat protein [bacterium]|nr:FG-GAP repeat protein [bacterium]
MYTQLPCDARQSLAVGAFSQQAYLKASNAESNDFLGNGQMDFDCETMTLAIGTISESSSAVGVDGNQADNSISGAGAVYVFRFSNGAWAQEAYIKASNTNTSDAFGRTLSLSGELLAVGTTNEDSAATGIGGDQNDNSAGDAGAVYVFRREGATWAQEAYIKASNTEASDAFGTAVALSGDVLAVGASSEDSNAAGVNGDQANNVAGGSGAVYIFRRNAAIGWVQEAYLKASNTGNNDAFGSKVSIFGDTLAVSAIGEGSNATGVGGNQLDNSVASAGAVYIFRNAGFNWFQEAYIKASNPDGGDNFGDSLSISDDVLAVGASQEASNGTGVGGNQADNSAFAAGAVYVFSRLGGQWAQQIYLKASNSESPDLFGHSVQISRHILAVGAINEDSIARGFNGNQADNTAADSGAVYVFLNRDGVWEQSTFLKSSNSDANDNFGNRIALSGDVLAVVSNNEDSLSTGVNGDQSDNAGTNAGAAYVFQ